MITKIAKNAIITLNTMNTMHTLTTMHTMLSIAAKDTNITKYAIDEMKNINYNNDKEYNHNTGYNDYIEYKS